MNPEDHAVVLPAPLSSMAEHTDRAAEIMFETFSVPALHVASQPELAMYASSLARFVEVCPAAPQERGGCFEEMGAGGPLDGPAPQTSAIRVQG